ncbi:hypothetical protein [Flavobacterium sp. 25HG05S-40]|uniref:hypothetical protein n=1 Tax=Flavobacterium sp. 25HG05S-40 TaxID=3458682 RepID=UPI004043B4DB
MGKKILILFLTLSLSIYSQKLKCCKTIEEVKRKLEGNWIVKNGDSNLVYQYSFTGEIGRIHKEEKKDVLRGIVSMKIHEPNFKLRRSLFGYKIKYTTPAGGCVFIKYLDTEKMILKKDGELIEYQRFIK